MAHVLAKDLRDSVLEAAFKGDLSTHHATDSKIECYRNEVLNTTRITSKKDITKAIENDELNDMPDIPDNWTYVRLNDVVAIEIKRGKSPKYDEKGEALAFAQKCNSKYDGIQLKLAKHLSNESLSRYKEHENMKDYDIVINSTGGGTLGRVGLYREYYNQLNVPVYPDSHVTVIRAKNNVNSSYLYLYVKKLSPYLETLGEGSTNQTELKPQVLKDLLVPLPPIEEQARIVAKVDEIMARIDEYEKLENQLVKLKEQFPQDMKDSLLQAGVMGKLTVQKETNSIDDIFDGVQPNFDEDDSCFDIPDNWCWCYLKDVADILGGFAFKSTNYTKDGIRVIRISDFNEDGFVDKNIVKYQYHESLSKYKIQKKDILMCMTGGTVGKNYYIEELNEELLLNQRVADIRSKMVNNDYMNIIIKSPFIQQIINDNKNSTNDNISMNLINRFPTPLPPIEEQQRIVDKLDELLPLVDKLAGLN